MRMALDIPEGNRQREFLDYLNSALRQRIASSSGSATRLEDGRYVSTLTGPFRVNGIFIPLSWTLTRSADNRVLQSLEVESAEGAPPESHWHSTILEFVNSVLAASISSKRTSYFRRSFFFYIGSQLDGEYWLPGFRFAPVNPEEDQPFLINAERTVSIDMNIEAVDEMHAIALSEEASKRHAARLSLLLNHGLYRQDCGLRWGIPVENNGHIGSSVRYYSFYAPLKPDLDGMPLKGKACPLGKYKGSLTAKYTQAGTMLSLPKEARRILRNIDNAKPELRIAFDNGARLYQVGAVIGSQFPSAGLAYRVAAIDAISQANGSRSTIANFIKKHASQWPDLELLIDHLWGSIRSAHFHGGEFPLGEFSETRFMDLLLDTRETTTKMIHRNCYDLTREVIVNWMYRQLSSKGIENDSEELPV